WAGLYLHTDAGVTTTPYKTLHFAARASQTGQRYNVRLYDTNNRALPSVPLTNYGGDPINTAWKIYNIPLSALSGSGELIKGIVIQEDKGTAQPVVYIDDIKFQ
ncbi:MAG TPA: hypothetical protein VEP90_16005, partial [Methylomirabilota bacterium]|nr:hypothetical protein [Methylomirabilota bacterium]